MIDLQSYADGHQRLLEVRYSDRETFTKTGSVPNQSFSFPANFYVAAQFSGVLLLTGSRTNSVPDPPLLTRLQEQTRGCYLGSPLVSRLQMLEMLLFLSPRIGMATVPDPPSF